MLLTDFHGQASANIDAAPAEAFTTITAIDRLPEWNERIAAVTRTPGTPLDEGVEWTVEMHVPPATWPSRSRVLTYDPVRLLFEHTSQSDDGNPSYVVWRWSVVPEGDGARVTVEWTARPKTFWRRLLFARLRPQTAPARGTGVLACPRPSPHTQQSCPLNGAAAPEGSLAEPGCSSQNRTWGVRLEQWMPGR